VKTGHSPAIAWQTAELEELPLCPGFTSVITSKPAICDHFKTGQRSWAQDMKLFYRVGTSSGKFFSISL
jgi:hypothetical protein